MQNPYQPPETNLLKEVPQEYCELNLLSAKGRLGRLRLILHNNLIQFGLSSMGAIIRILTPEKHITAISLPLLIISILFLYILICSIIKRLHDLNLSGKWLLAIPFTLIPLFLFKDNQALLGATVLTWLIFFIITWILPGSKSENKYGYPPPPNTLWVYAPILIMLLVPLAIIIAPFVITYLYAPR